MTPSFPPLKHVKSAADIPGFTPASNSLSHVRMLTGSEFDDQKHYTFDDTKYTTHDFKSLASQLSGLTSIASNLQREMTNLSRRSKDNAHDLMLIREAAKSRDEEIRQSLRDLQQGLTSFEAADRLLGASPARLALGAPSSSSGEGSDYGEEHSKAIQKSTEALERLMREMPTKEDQDSALAILADIRDKLKTEPRGDTGFAEEKILALLEDIREREEAHSKQLIRAGALPPQEDDERVFAMLEQLRKEIYTEKPADAKIMSILEELKQKEVDARDDARILSALEELKRKDSGEDERLDRIVSLLESLRDRESDSRAVSLLEDVIGKIQQLNEDFSKKLEGVTVSGVPGQVASNPQSYEEVLKALDELKQSMNGDEEAGKHIRRSLEDWKMEYERTIGSTLADLRQEIEMLAAEQRAASGRMSQASFVGSTSQALTTLSGPPNLSMPQNLDNDAAITALANIASTTLRTDITLSSISALIRVFQKEQHTATINNAETMSAMGRYVEDMDHAMRASNNHASETRKILEVIRTHVCTSNDRLADFEGVSRSQLDELNNLVKHLHRSIFGDNDQAPWIHDLGVKDDVEALNEKINNLAEKNLQAFRKTLETIESNSPASLIVELQQALGAMAQRSLQAFKASENEVQLLKKEVADSAQRTESVIKDANPAENVKAFRAEFQEMAQKTLSVCESIDKKFGENSEVKEVLLSMKSELGTLLEKSTNSVETFKSEMDSRIEDVIATAVAAASSDEKTAAALEELKMEVSNTLNRAVALADKPDESEKFIRPLNELRKEIAEIVEKSNSALAAPAGDPEIKTRIETLTRDLTQAMEKTSEMASSSTATEALIKDAVENLRREIGDMGESVAAAVATSSSSGLQATLDELKDSVLVKVEESIITSDKAIGSIADLSRDTREMMDALKTDVSEMLNNSISMAIMPRPKTESGIDKQLLDALRIDIEDAIVSAVAAGTGSDEIKEMIENLKSDVAAMGKQISVPTANPEETVKTLLETMKVDLGAILEKASASAVASPSSDITESIESLRKELREVIQKNGSIVAPIARESGDGIDSSLFGKIEQVVTDLKADVNEMIETTLAAAIANTTFDSEEKVKEAMEELKRDVKDTLEKSMVPHLHGYSDAMLREAMGVLRQEIAAMFEKRATVEVEDKEDIVGRLDSLKAHFGELLQNSSNVEVKDAVDVLKSQVHGLLERSSGAEFADLREAIEGLRIGGGGTGSAVSDPAILEKLTKLQEQFADIDVNTIATLSLRIGDLAEKSVDSELKASLDAIQTRLNEIATKQTGADAEQVDALRTQVATIALDAAASGGNSQAIVDALKAEIQAVIEKSTGSLSKLDDVVEVKVLVEDLKKDLIKAMSKAPATSVTSPEEFEALKADLKAMMEQSLTVREAAPVASAAGPQLEEIRATLDILKADIKNVLDKSVKTIAGPPTAEGHAPAINIDTDAIVDVGAAVGECRVEVAVVRALVEEKANRTNIALAGISRAHEESKGLITAVKKAAEEYRTVSSEATGSVKSTIQDFASENREMLSGLRTHGTESHQKTVSELKAVMASSKDEYKEAFEGISQGVESAKVEISEAVQAVDTKLDSSTSNIKDGIAEIKVSLEQTKTDQEAATATLAATIETSQVDTKEEVAVVKKLVEESKTANDDLHDKTQRQVDQVLSMVDGLQAEWKGQQPTLFDALTEMKRLLVEAQEAAAKKPEIELPPPYDDSQAQKKLDQLVAGQTSQAKQLPQLGLLDSIQKQVSQTSSDIAQFLAHQKTITLENAAAKAKACHNAELELERAIAERRVVEAKTEDLQEEHEKLQATVEVLREDAEDLRVRKFQLAAELAGIETALTLRREELIMLEARGEALERRMMEGVIEQSRALLSKSSARSMKLSKSARDAALKKVKYQPPPRMQERRNFSLNIMGHGSPGSNGRLGLGQKDYSSTLGIIGRSQSVKHASYSLGRSPSLKRDIENVKIRPKSVAPEMPQSPVVGVHEDDILEEEDTEQEDDEVYPDPNGEHHYAPEYQTEHHYDELATAEEHDNLDDDIDHLDDLSEYEEGSVIRVEEPQHYDDDIEYDEEPEPEPAPTPKPKPLKRKTAKLDRAPKATKPSKSRVYPAGLNLDFSDGASRRDSGRSNYDEV